MLTISGAAKQWGVSRETIYRKHRAGELSFATAEPPTIDGAEMVRVFGEPKPKRPRVPISADEAALLARLEAERDRHKADAERLAAELAMTKQELHVERTDARQERQRLLDLVTSQQKLIEDRTKTSPQPAEATRPWWRRLRG
jgi:hypothetical protein